MPNSTSTINITNMANRFDYKEYGSRSNLKKWRRNGKWNKAMGENW